MVYSLLLGSTLLRTQRTIFPRTFSRSKSITAAIERGRQSRPDRAPRPRTRPQFEKAVDGLVKTRREKRFEQFGRPRDDNDATSKPHNGRVGRDRVERVTTPRSGRSIYASQPGSREAFSRNSEDQPLSGRDAPLQKPREERRDQAFDRDRKPTSNRFARERGPYPGRMEAKRPAQDRFSRKRVPFPGRAEVMDRAPYSDRVDARGPRQERFAERERLTSKGDDAASNSNDRDLERGYMPRSDRLERYPMGGDQSSLYATRFRSDDRPNRDGNRVRSGAYHSERDNSYRSSRKQPETRGETKAYVDTQQTSVRGPESFPYTTAASEFIYGYSSVLAAIKANRRKLYNIYIHSRGSHRDGLMTSIRAQKLFSITNEVGEEYLRVMDKVSSGRPHNGIVLEASALPVPPITELRTASIEDESFSVVVDSQTAEDLAVNGKQELYSYKSEGWRHPLILYADGVLDEGNLGAIARSAYFLGVDAIITPTRQTAPWSHIALKASTGAAEAIPVFKVGDPAEFLGRSSRAGWRIYASDAVSSRPSPTSNSEPENESVTKVIYTIARSTKRLPAGHSPVSEHPTILMMGGEGTGLRNSLQNLAHYKVGIPHGRDVDELGVDSLNVSVAASLLCYEMLQKPRSQSKPAPNPEEVLF